MFIKKIQMKDYKRFHDLTIDLGDSPKRIVALVGRNGCGKSSVFDAMLYRNNEFGGLGSGNVLDYHYHSLLGDSSINPRNITIEFDQGDYRIVWNNRRLVGKERSIFSFRSSICFTPFNRNSFTICYIITFSTTYSF